MADSNNNRQFLGVSRFGGTPAPRVFVDEGQPGGREIPGGLGLLSNTPISRVPTASLGLPTSRPFATEISPELRRRIADVESRKR